MLGCHQDLSEKPLLSSPCLKALGPHACACENCFRRLCATRAPALGVAFVSDSQYKDPKPIVDLWVGQIKDGLNDNQLVGQLSNYSAQPNECLRGQVKSFQRKQFVNCSGQANDSMKKGQQSSFSAGLSSESMAKKIDAQRDGSLAEQSLKEAISDFQIEKMNNSPSRQLKVVLKGQHDTHSEGQFTAFSKEDLNDCTVEQPFVKWPSNDVSTKQPKTLKLTDSSQFRINEISAISTRDTLDQSLRVLKREISSSSSFSSALEAATLNYLAQPLPMHTQSIALERTSFAEDPCAERAPELSPLEAQQNHSISTTVKNCIPLQQSPFTPPLPISARTPCPAPSLLPHQTSQPPTLSSIAPAALHEAELKTSPVVKGIAPTATSRTLSTVSRTHASTSATAPVVTSRLIRAAVPPKAQAQIQEPRPLTLGIPVPSPPMEHLLRPSASPAPRLSPRPSRLSDSFQKFGGVSLSRMDHEQLKVLPLIVSSSDINVDPYTSSLEENCMINMSGSPLPSHLSMSTAASRRDIPSPPPHPQPSEPSVQSQSLRSQSLRNFSHHMSVLRSFGLMRRDPLAPLPAPPCRRTPALNFKKKVALLCCCCCSEKTVKNKRKKHSHSQ